MPVAPRVQGLPGVPRVRAERHRRGEGGVAAAQGRGYPRVRGVETGGRVATEYRIDQQRVLVGFPRASTLVLRIGGDRSAAEPVDDAMQG